jgi:hypothetical protein
MPDQVRHDGDMAGQSDQRERPPVLFATPLIPTRIALAPIIVAAAKCTLAEPTTLPAEPKQFADTGVVRG